METNEPDDRSPVVVGIGASAGGLAAFSDLLKNLPPDTGMAFALVQHLDPKHESILPELLAGKTQMPVLKVQQDTTVEPNRVYVIPPNSRMLMSGNLLRLEPRPDGPDQFRPIDSFFASLANELHSRAVGVVLSGAASDGTLGLKAIKSEGGITFAQDSSATFDSMPRSAIAAGTVDFVLSPSQIANELAAIGRHSSYIRDFEAEISGDGSALHRLLILLRNNTGVDFTQYKHPTVFRRVTRRMVLRKAETLDQYVHLVQKEPHEAKALFDDMLINVTEFFRDPGVFEAAKRTAFPAAFEDRKPSEMFRAWVPGCSSGEEVYSLAITLLEYLEENGMDVGIQLFGTDVSDITIERARSALYGEGAVVNVSPERLRRFFVKTDRGYQITRTVREMCIFSRHNLAKDPPLSRMDVISCRNVLIYFSPTLQKRVISTLGYALQPAGCLILGSSETLGSLEEFFTPFDSEHKIYCRKPNAAQRLFDLSARHFSQPGVSFSQQWGEKAVESASAPPPEIHKAVNDILLSQFSLSGFVIDECLRVVEHRGDTDRFLLASANGCLPELMQVLKQEYRAAASQVIEVARKNASRASADGGGANVTAVPLAIKNAQPHFLLLFGAERAATPEREHEVEATTRTTGKESQQIADLKQELRSTREYLQSVIEELRSTNEESQSANEELQSTNEEVQTAKEELQSANEELNTINAEMQSRNSELTELNNDLTNLLSSINTPIVMTGSDLRIRRFTPTAEKALRLIPSDVGRPISDLKPRINVENLEELFQGVLDSLQPHEQEVSDQEGRSYLMRLRPYRTADNRIDGAVLLLLDVTELKESLARVQRAKTYAEALVATVRGPLVVMDQECRIRDANQAFYDAMRLTEQSAVGRSIFEVGSRALDLPELRNLVKQLSESDSPLRDIEFEYKRPDGVDARGEVRTVMLNGRRLKGFEEQQLLLLLAFEDITERKKAAEARYRRLFESARDGIVVLNAESGHILEVNPFTEHLLGFQRDEMAGREIWETESFRNIPDLRTQLARIRDHGALRFDDMPIRTKEGNEILTEVIANVFTENERRAIQLNIRDVTERKKFERELRDTQRLESLGLLAGGIAHDFNNLLTGILGNASVLMSRTASDTGARTNVREIIRASERAAFLTRQMLAYAGKGRFVSEMIRLPEVVSEISTLIRTSIPKTVELRIDASDDLPPIEGDPGQIQQLVMNLVINGAEAIGEGAAGRVDVRTRVREINERDARELYSVEQLAPGTYVWLEVTDTGCGMDEATLAKIFDPFFTTKFTGRGLGLAAVQGIVRGHRGAMRVYSTPGTGTHFDVLFPARRPVPEEQRPLDSPPAVIPTGAVILIVDDEDIVRKVASSILSRHGFKVLAAPDGLTGVEMFREHRLLISLVLLDLLMPVMSGKDALARMREMSTEVPIVITSGFDESEATRQLGDLAPDGFLIKPFTDRLLIEVVSKALASFRTKAV